MVNRPRAVPMPFLKSRNKGQSITSNGFGTSSFAIRICIPSKVLVIRSTLFRAALNVMFIARICPFFETIFSVSAPGYLTRRSRRIDPRAFVPSSYFLTWNASKPRTGKSGTFWQFFIVLWHLRSVNIIMAIFE